MSNMLQVTTVLGCKNSMLREGLKHILASTRYKVHPGDLARPDIGLSLSGDVPLLIIISADYYSGGMADAIRALKDGHPGAHVVILADDFDLSGMMTALEAGASGYCLSSAGCEALIKYLDLVMLGEVVFPSAKFFAAAAAGREVGNAPKEIIVAKAEASQSGSLMERADSPTRNLSSREAEILLCLMQGAPNKVIARRLEVAEATVKVHIKAILRKIRVANRTQAAMWAVNNMSGGQGDSIWLASGDGAVAQASHY